MHKCADEPVLLDSLLLFRSHRAQFRFHLPFHQLSTDSIRMKNELVERPGAQNSLENLPLARAEPALEAQKRWEVGRIRDRGLWEPGASMTVLGGAAHGWDGRQSTTPRAVQIRQCRESGRNEWEERTVDAVQKGQLGERGWNGHEERTFVAVQLAQVDECVGDGHQERVARAAQRYQIDKLGGDGRQAGTAGAIQPRHIDERRDRLGADAAHGRTGWKCERMDSV